jgi:hypothetical protein
MDERPALYVGIDVGKRWHQAAFVGPDGNDLAKTLRFANTSEGYAAFKARLEAAARGGRVRMALEATGHYWMALYQRLNDDGHEVVVLCVCKCARSGRCKSSSGRRSPACNRRKPRRREAGWEATRGEWPVRNESELDSAVSRGEPASQRRSPNRRQPDASHAEG